MNTGNEQFIKIKSQKNTKLKKNRTEVCYSSRYERKTAARHFDTIQDIL